MVQPKYSPEEALERVKLMMKYDTSKTLNENKVIASAEVISEAPAKDPNVLTDEDLLGNTGKIRQYFQTVSDFGALVGLPNLWDTLGINMANILSGRRVGVKGIVDALDGWVDEKDLAYVLSTIKTLDGKCYYDDVEGVSVPAIARFIELYKEDENGDDLIADINGVGTRTLPTGTDKIKQKIVKLVGELSSKSCGGTKIVPKKGYTPEKKDGNKKKTSTGGVGYKNCAGAYSFGCKASAIATVQGCLGLVADGKFGPKTRAALSKLNIKSFTDGEIKNICSSKSQTTPKSTPKQDEFTTQVDADKVDDILNQ